MSLTGIIGDLRVLPNLSNPNMPEWLRFGIPAETLLNFFGLAYSFLTLLVIYGLWTARSWSYDFGLALPIFVLILNFAGLMLYASAPPELGIGAEVTSVFPVIFWNLIFLGVTWSYLTRPHVKQYLNRIPSPPPTPVPAPPIESALSVPPPPEPVPISGEMKFCRYCGEENKMDAIFCEKCGKKIE